MVEKQSYNTTMTPVLYQNETDCCGCKACANTCPRDAISFIKDKDGFEYPAINEEKCIGCNKCAKTCDFQKRDVSGCKPIKGYAARHKDSAVYSDSTSGGVFTALSEFVIDRGGFVYGCVFDEKMMPVHKAVGSLDGLSAMRGSKYAQSDIGFVYRDVKKKLKEDKYVLFTGTPCQIAGLSSYLGNTDTSKLLTADLVCHGVPSREAFKTYLDYLESKYHSKVISFQFRNKLFGWLRPVISVVFETCTKKWWFPTEDVYYSNFIKSNLQRPSCFYCKYSCEYRFGDITIGDFWGFQKADLKMPYKEGVSCCLINNPKAIEVFKSINITAEEVNPDLIIQGNVHLRRTSPKGKNRETVLERIRTEGFKTMAKEYKKANSKLFIKAFVKKIILRKSLIF